MSTADVFNVIDEPLAQELEDIFREHYTLVYRTAYSVTGNPQDAEDAALQDQLGKLGLRLQSAKVPDEFIVIEHAELPTEN